MVLMMVVMVIMVIRYIEAPKWRTHIVGTMLGAVNSVYISPFATCVFHRFFWPSSCICGTAIGR